MIPSLRGVQRQRLSPGVFGHQQHCAQQQHLLLSTPSRRSASMAVPRSLVQSNRLVNTPADHAAASIQQGEAAPPAPYTLAGSTAAAEPDDLTAAAEHALLHGNGLARAILSDPGIEGDPLAFLKATEAYWKVSERSTNVLHCGTNVYVQAWRYAVLGYPAQEPHRVTLLSGMVYAAGLQRSARHALLARGNLLLSAMKRECTASAADCAAGGGLHSAAEVVYKTRQHLRPWHTRATTQRSVRV